MRILVVEDDPLVGDAIFRTLMLAGFTTDFVASVELAGAALAAEPFDLLVLDIGPPKQNGLQLAASLRSRGKLVPILMVTARYDDNRVNALDLGTDDCLVKPFMVPELVARARALIRRANDCPTALSVGKLQIDLRRKEVFAQGTQVELTEREWSIIRCLALDHGDTVFWGSEALVR